MNVYDVVIDPTVIADCVACNFINSSQKHLIVGKSTTLEVYEVLKVKPDSPTKDLDYKLKLISSFKLQGLIKNVKSIRTVENPHLDYVLVSTASAKVSCIKWDLSKHSITTVSLHFYENAFQNALYEKISDTELIVDSLARPLFCLRQNNILALLPFNGADDDDDDDGEEEEKEAQEANLNISDSSGKYPNHSFANKLEGATAEDSKEKSHDNPSQNLKIAPGNIRQPRQISEKSIDLFDTSAIIDATTFDPTIGEIVDLQFLHNYREPTVAVLSQVNKTWTGLLPERMDNIAYSVWSLNLISPSATTVLKIESLPYDVHRIIPLSYPLNGSLLVGCNELIHIDNGGITRRVALNSFVSDITQSSKDFVDETSKELRLEDCSITMVPNDSRVLMVLKSGDVYIISFEVDGKTVKGLRMDELEPSLYGGLNLENPGTIVTLDENLLFFVSKTSDSILVEIAYSKIAKSNDEDNLVSQRNMENVEDEEDDDSLYDDDDELNDNSAEKSRIQLHMRDSLRSSGPISSFTLGKLSPEKFIANLPNPSFNEVSIVGAGGVGKSSHLSLMTPTVQPIIKSSLRFSQIHRLWIIGNQYLITSDDANNKSEIFDINRSYARIPSKNFINADLTIAMHELFHGSFILQVTPRQILLFDDKLEKLSSLDEELKEFGDAVIINSVLSDEILMIFFSTGEVVIYSINTYSKAFTKLELPKLLSDTIITTGYITNSRLLSVVSEDISVVTNRGQKRNRDAELLRGSQDKSIGSAKMKTFVLVTGDNRIVVFARFHNEKCYQLNSVNKFTNRLSLNFFDINGADPDPFIKQVILNDLGDEYTKDEYLTILTVGGELFTYKMYFDGENFAFVKEVNLPITGAPQNAYPQGTSLERRMTYFPNVSGLTCVMVTGVVPYLITRSSHSLAKIHKFSKIPIISFVPYSDDKINHGLIYLDTKKNARIVELPTEFNYDNNWPIRRIPIGETIKYVAYHESSHTFVLSTYKDIPYKCLDEDEDPIIGSNANKPPASSYKGQIQLLSPITWTSIDSFSLADNEIGLQVKSLALDIGSGSKRFKRKKEIILIGTGKYRMEDLASNGSYRLLEIIDIIPEPGRPETNHKFKEITQEDTRGAVTSICDVSGRFLTAQGQKVIVRDIKDATAMSVAFMDLSVYISEAKSFGNVILFGDSLKSITLAGFDAEPFRMILLGKDMHSSDVSCADFIYKDEEIFILMADNDKMIHLLQYNPEDPSSANGQRLLRKSSFNTNLSATCMKTIPKHDQLSESVDANNAFQIIASTAEGGMYVVFPINDATYRRMFILQQQIMDKEYHHCGLNPRSNRVGGSRADPDQTLRPILNCEILRRYAKLNRDRMHSLGQKISVKSLADDMWRDLIGFENVLNNL